MIYNGEQAETNKSKANLFAKFFASVFIESSHFIPVEEVNTCRILEQIQFDEKEVLILCKDAKTNKSRGPDDTLLCICKLNRYRHISVRVGPPIPQTCLKACKIGNLALILRNPRHENRRFSESEGMG